MNLIGTMTETNDKGVVKKLIGTPFSGFLKIEILLIISNSIFKRSMTNHISVVILKDNLFNIVKFVWNKSFYAENSKHIVWVILMDRDHKGTF